jgi:hypothetical protein
LQSEQIRGAVAALSHRHRDVIHSCDGLATAFSALSGGVTAPATIGGVHEQGVGPAPRGSEHG